MGTSVVRSYRGVDAETRRNQRREQLLEACLDVVANSGIAATSVEAICSSAGLSKRYFYESFQDRDAILVSALDRVFSPLPGRLAEELVECETMRERVELTATLLVRSFTTDPRAANLYISASASPALEERRRQVVDEFTPVLVQAVLGADPDDTRARSAAIMMVAGTSELLDRWLRNDLDFTEEGFIRTITEIGEGLADISRKRKK